MDFAAAQTTEPFTGERKVVYRSRGATSNGSTRSKIFNKDSWPVKTK